jgi:hypothetical protein
MPVVEELLTKARHFHVLARKTSDPVTKERLLRLGEDYLAQADQLTSERKVVQAPTQNLLRKTEIPELSGCVR